MKIIDEIIKVYNPTTLDETKLVIRELAQQSLGILKILR